MTRDKTQGAAMNAALPPHKLDLHSLPTAPDKAFYNPDPRYIRALIEATGLTQHAVATKIGVSERAMRYYVTPAENKELRSQKAPYAVQFTLERLAASVAEN